MSEDIVEDTKRKLDELERKIQAARSSFGARGEIAGEADEHWKEMVRTHAGISQKLDAAKDQPAEVLEGVRFDIDILRHSFEKWMARVEGNFAQDGKRNK
jgi:hypothetical protein